MLQFFRRFLTLKGIQITLLVQKLQQFCWMDGFCLLVELQRWRVCVCSLRSRLVYERLAEPRNAMCTKFSSKKIQLFSICWKILNKRLKFFLPQRQYTVFLFSGYLIRKQYHLLLYYFTAIYEIVPFMIVTIFFRV